MWTGTDPRLDTVLIRPNGQEITLDGESVQTRITPCLPPAHVSPGLATRDRRRRKRVMESATRGKVVDLLL